MNFPDYTGSKDQVRNRPKIKFVQLDCSNSIFQKISTDVQGGECGPHGTVYIQYAYLVSFLITLKFAGSSGATTVQFVLATLHW